MKYKIILLLLLLLPLVSADSYLMGRGSNFIGITEIEEIIHINGRDLAKSIGINLYFEKQKGNSYKPTNFTFYLTPERATESFPFETKNVDFKVCIGGFGGHSYDKMNPQCERELPYEIIERKSSWSDWSYIVDLSNVAFYESIIITISYEEENFLTKGVNKLLRLNTICQPRRPDYKGCPNPKGNLVKHVILPKYADKVDVKNNKAILELRKSGNWRITQRDFTPNDELSNQYEPLLISYEEKENLLIVVLKWVWKNIILVIITGLVITILSFLIKNRIKDRKPLSIKLNSFNLSGKKELKLNISFRLFNNSDKKISFKNIILWYPHVPGKKSGFPLEPKPIEAGGVLSFLGKFRTNLKNKFKDEIDFYLIIKDSKDICYKFNIKYHPLIEKDTNKFMGGGYSSDKDLKRLSKKECKEYWH